MFTEPSERLAIGTAHFGARGGRGDTSGAQRLGGSTVGVTLPYIFTSDVINTGGGGRNAARRVTSFRFDEQQFNTGEPHHRALRVAGIVKSAQSNVAADDAG